MATIKEDFVSFETAKLLKEKGFDSDEVGCYGGFYSEGCYESGHGIKTQSGQEVGIVYDDLTNSELEHDEYLRPTLQMAMKWLREVHKKWITITFHWHTVDGETTLYYSPYIMLSECKNIVLEDKNPFKIKLFTSYEQACEAAIKYCLENLI